MYMYRFEEGGEFRTNTPLPQLRFTLKMETQGLLNNEKLLAKVIIIMSCDLHVLYLESSYCYADSN